MVGHYPGGNEERYLRNVTERRTFAMERACDFGGCKVEGIFELVFRDCQHPFHSRHGPIFFWTLFEVVKNLADEPRVLDGSGPHRASKLHRHVRRRLGQGWRGRDTVCII